MPPNTLTNNHLLHFAQRAFPFTALRFNQPVFLSESHRWRRPIFKVLHELVDEVSWAFANMAGGGILPIKFTELLQVCSHTYSEPRTRADEVLLQLTNVGIAVCCEDSLHFRSAGHWLGAQKLIELLCAHLLTTFYSLLQ